MSFDPNEKQSVSCERKLANKLHKACERASEIRERTLHTPVGTKQNVHGKHERVTRQ